MFLKENFIFLFLGRFRIQIIFISYPQYCKSYCWIIIDVSDANKLVFLTLTEAFDEVLWMTKKYYKSFVTCLMLLPVSLLLEFFLSWSRGLGIDLMLPHIVGEI